MCFLFCLEKSLTASTLQLKRKQGKIGHSKKAAILLRLRRMKVTDRRELILVVLRIVFAAIWLGIGGFGETPFSLWLVRILAIRFHYTIQGEIKRGEIELGIV